MQHFSKKIISVSCIVFFTIQGLLAQKTNDNGMRQEAIKLYQIHKYAYAEKSFVTWMQENASVTDTLVLKLLADCEWKLRKYSDAYQTYWRLYRVPGFVFTSETKQHFADLNAMCNKYSDGIEVLNSDAKWTKKKQGFYSVDAYKTDSLDWVISYPSFNSIASEYLPYYPGKDLLFFNTDHQANDYKYKVNLWSGGSFSNIKYCSGISNMPLSSLKYPYKHGNIDNFNSSLNKTGGGRKLAIMHEQADIPLLNHPLYSWADSINHEKGLNFLKLKPENYFNKGCISVQTTNDTSGKTPVYFIANNNNKSYIKNYLKKDTSINPLCIYKGNLSFNNNEISVGDIKQMKIEDFDGELLHATISNNGQILVFSAKENNRNDYDLYWAVRGSDLTWNNVTALDKNINTFGNEVFPQLQNDGTLYFSSDGLPGMGALDIFKIKNFYSGNRVNTKNFPEHLGYPFNTAFDDYGVTVVNQSTEKILNKELQVEDGFFTSNRAGSDDIFHFRYKENYIIACGFIGERSADGHNSPLSNAKVVIKQKSADNSIVADSALTDSQGKYCFAIKSNKRYDVNASKQGWFPATDIFTFKSLPDSIINSYAINPIILDKEPAKPVIIVDTVSKNIEPEKFFIIHHYFDKTTVCTEDLAIIDSAVAYILSHANCTVEITSAADCFGTARYAEKLSKKRIETITVLLKERGINVSVSRAVGQNERMIDCNKAMTIARQLPNRYTKILVKLKK
jgi:hypothetical protein